MTASRYVMWSTCCILQLIWCPVDWKGPWEGRTQPGNSQITEKTLPLQTTVLIFTLSYFYVTTETGAGNRNRIAHTLYSSLKRSHFYGAMWEVVLLVVSPKRMIGYFYHSSQLYWASECLSALLFLYLFWFSLTALTSQPRVFNVASGCFKFLF